MGSERTEAETPEALKTETRPKIVHLIVEALRVREIHDTTNLTRGCQGVRLDGGWSVSLPLYRGAIPAGSNRRVSVRVGLRMVHVRRTRTASGTSGRRDAQRLGRTGKKKGGGKGKNVPAWLPGKIRNGNRPRMTAVGGFQAESHNPTFACQSVSFNRINRQRIVTGAAAEKGR